MEILVRLHIGYLLLAGRVRKQEEEDIIKTVLEKHFKRTLNCDNLFSLTEFSPAMPNILQHITKLHTGFENIVWTLHARRMAVLIGYAITFDEPVLLVGETGYVISF